MRIYLDNCCFNRPFDDQTQIRIRLESEAKLFIQDKIVEGSMELAWSYIPDYENSLNPFEERRLTVDAWKARAGAETEANEEVLQTARELSTLGVRSKDALHVACAVSLKCDYFLTTDDALIKRLGTYPGVRVIDPVTFVRSALL